MTYSSDDQMSIVSALVPGTWVNCDIWYFAVTPLGLIPVAHVDSVTSPAELEDATRLAITMKFGDMWRALVSLRGMNYGSFSWN